MRRLMRRFAPRQISAHFWRNSAQPSLSARASVLTGKAFGQSLGDLVGDRFTLAIIQADKVSSGLVVIELELRTPPPLGGGKLGSPCWPKFALPRQDPVLVQVVDRAVQCRYLAAARASIQRSPYRERPTRSRAWSRGMQPFGQKLTHPPLWMPPQRKDARQPGAEVPAFGDGDQPPPSRA
jgi:hypothetical protein